MATTAEGRRPPGRLLMCGTLCAVPGFTFQFCQSYRYDCLARAAAVPCRHAHVKSTQAGRGVGIGSAPSLYSFPRDPKGGSWTVGCGPVGRIESQKRSSRLPPAACPAPQRRPGGKNLACAKNSNLPQEKAFASNDGYSGLNAFLSVNYSFPFCRRGYRASLLLEGEGRRGKSLPSSFTSFIHLGHTCASFVCHQRPSHLPHTCSGWRPPLPQASQEDEGVVA
ncbi:hypothetical protein E2C01_027709 [Portunus trituberculatus]|uniref:Uncharacterized protein n=1 Tax=Portunus trituberculatus TaxID=210409 RepID=A0A5B7EJE2_PORTR|nr:hypothetical protein [Portunus trituberculatus]